MKSFSSLITIALLFLLSTTFSCGRKPPEIEEPIPVTAPDLLAEYLPAGQKAELRYSNKQLLVSGVIARVKPEEGVVILKGKEDPISLNGVECYFILNDENKEKLDLLVQGQGVIVQGLNKGFNVGFVRLEDCEVKGF